MTKKSDDVFCESWLQARQSFISRIQKLGGTYESIGISSKGPDQGELSIGVGSISLGPHALTTCGDLLLHISGVHGVEGFAGSAAQLQILDELLKQKNDGLFSDLPATDRPGEAGYNKDGQGNFEDLDFHNGFWGTSAATPNVAGLFALLLTHEPNLTREEALSRMKASAIKANPAAAQYNPSTGHSLHYGFGRAHAGRLFERQK